MGPRTKEKLKKCCFPFYTLNKVFLWVKAHYCGALFEGTFFFPQYYNMFKIWLLSKYGTFNFEFNFWCLWVIICTFTKLMLSNIIWNFFLNNLIFFKTMNIFIYTYVNQSPFFILNYTSYNSIGNPNQHLKKKKKKIKIPFSQYLSTFIWKCLKYQFVTYLRFVPWKKNSFVPWHLTQEIRLLTSNPNPDWTSATRTRLGTCSKP